MTRIGIIIGSTRPGRVGHHIAHWAAENAAQRKGLEVDLIDLAEVGLPFLDEEAAAGSGAYALPHTQAWASRISALDAVLLVTPEYNGSYPASLKNAVDFLAAEWRDLPVGIVAYGNTSSGARAAVALLPVVVGLQMIVGGWLLLGLRDRLVDDRLRFSESEAQGIGNLLARLQLLGETLQRRLI